MIWCYHSKTRGASVIYETAVRPLLFTYIFEEEINTKATTKKVVEKEDFPITVIAKIKQAKDLTQMDHLNKTADAFCTVEVEAVDKQKCGAEGVIYKTKVKPKTVNPSWNDTIEINKLPERSMHSNLRIILQNNTGFGSNEFIGEVSIPLSDFANGGKEKWFDLVDPEEKNPHGVQGEILVDVSVSSSKN